MAVVVSIKQNKKNIQKNFNLLIETFLITNQLKKIGPRFTYKINFFVKYINWNFFVSIKKKRQIFIKSDFFLIFFCVETIKGIYLFETTKLI